MNWARWLKRRRTNEKPEAALEAAAARMWQRDPKVQAEAMREVALYLEDSDPKVALKAATILDEQPGMAQAYLTKAHDTKTIQGRVRASILEMVKIALQQKSLGPKVDFAALAGEAREMMSQALAEVSLHGFSDRRSLEVALPGGTRVTCCLSIDVLDPMDPLAEVLLSLGYAGRRDIRISDADANRIIGHFARGAVVHPIEGVPTQINLRYFGWKVSEMRK
jgi:hypothetical protein